MSEKLRKRAQSFFWVITWTLFGIIWFWFLKTLPTTRELENSINKKLKVS